MRTLRILALSAVLSCFAPAAFADSILNCEQGKDYDLTIRGCSEVIRTNPSAF